MKSRMIDLYVCIVLAVALRFVFSDNVTYLLASGVAGMVYGTLKGISHE